MDVSGFKSCVFTNFIYPLFYAYSFLNRTFVDLKTRLYSFLGAETKIDKDGNYLVPVFINGERFLVLLKKKEYEFYIPMELNDKNGVIKTFGGPFQDFFYQQYMFEDFDLEDWDGEKIRGNFTRVKSLTKI